MARYILELLSYDYRRLGARAGLGVAYRFCRDRLLGRSRLVFQLNVDQRDGIGVEPSDAFQLEQHTCWSTVPDSLRRLIAAHPRLIDWDMNAMLTKGAGMWVGLVGGRPHGLGFSRTGDLVEDYFLPLTPTCAVLSHFAVWPEFRGRHLYSAMLGGIVQALFHRGIGPLYIDCAEWNVASQRGILRAGFRPIGIGRIRRNGHCTHLRGG